MEKREDRSGKRGEPEFVAIRGDRELLRALREAAKADDHEVIGATHAVMLDGQIAGYVSLGGLPTVHIWASTKLGTPRASLQGLRWIDETMQAAGQRQYLIPCDHQSPYHPLLAKRCPALGTATLFVRQLPPLTK